MTVAAKPEILDLRHFSARQLRTLLEHEAQIWRRRLRWDYQGSTELLLEYLDSRTLPGFVALDHGRLCGYAFCIYEDYKAVIGDAYASLGDEADSLQVTKTLLYHLIQMLRHSPGIERIESQLMLYPSGTIDDVFLAAGFRLFPRRLLERSLEQRAVPILVPEDLELASWSAGDFTPAAELIHRSYIGHIDAQVNDQYCSMQGSLRFLHNIVRFPGCGVFDEMSSWVLRRRQDRSLAGIVLCSDVGEHVRHVTQLCVAPEHRGRGLGEALMRQSFASLAGTGTQAVTLTVTEANRQAMRLYDALGFTTRHHFEAMVFDARIPR